MPHRVRHQPQQTALYGVVRDHLEEFLRLAREEHGGLPRFVEKTFRAYLDCGIPEKGFIRLHCESCGRSDIVAFSCKRRGVCPSCNARGMGDGAAHLVDHVLPLVPYRQYVLSFPFELNGALAFQPELLVATERLVMDALCRWQQQRGGGKPGGVFIRHRFGGALNLHIHGHVLLMDGVYQRDGDAFTFRATGAPTADELGELALNIHRRLLTLLKRRGLLGEAGADAPARDALRACVEAALSAGTRSRQGPALSVAEEDEVEQPRGGTVARVGGLNLYASAPLRADDRETLERLCRYLLRGPLALGRLKRRPDGMLTYHLKRADRRGNTVLVLTPVELLMRLASLIPAPGHPVRKYFGILAPGARDRNLVVPASTRRKRGHAHGAVGEVARAVAWSELLKRVWGLDALHCSRCGGRMTPLAVITDHAEASRFLAGTGGATEYPLARGPPEQAA